LPFNPIKLSLCFSLVSFGSWAIHVPFHSSSGFGSTCAVVASVVAGLVAGAGCVAAAAAAVSGVVVC